MTTDTSAEEIAAVVRGLRPMNGANIMDDGVALIGALAAERDRLRRLREHQGHEIGKLHSQLDRAKHQLAEARNAALEDVIAHSWIAFHNCDEEFNVVSVGDIRALISPTTGEDSNG